MQSEPLAQSATEPSARRILIVEDDEDIRKTLESILNGEGFAVETCADGRAALAALATRPKPDLIILDLRMPTMDGWQFRVQQKSDPAWALIPVIAISADASPQAAAVDAAAYLRKPFNFAALMATIDRVLLAFDRRRAHPHLASVDARDSEMRRLKNAFIGNISYEIRRPLNALLSLTQLLRDGSAGPLTSEQRHYLEVIQRSGEGVLQLMGRILDLANLEDGSLVLSPEEVSLLNLVQSTVASLTVEAQAKELALVIDVPSAGFPRVHVDAYRLSQVVRYLVENAIKFTEHGTVKVTADVSPDRRWVNVHVSDTGIGIPEALLPLLFDGFYQVDHRLERRHPGAGLGLTLVDRLVRAMGGRVSVGTAVGIGSRFTVALPAATDA
ncbi:MAG TPA: hybrid sensor histidine kinase/response regulator [Polyangia bacterium]|nr:hybrid sensor histidine kinase/response regulator [Polyangia bacterium]